MNENMGDKMNEQSCVPVKLFTKVLLFTNKKQAGFVNKLSLQKIRFGHRPWFVNLH